MMNRYTKRRQQLAKRLPSNTLAIIPAATECLRNGDAHHRFRQASDFYYLTGFHEPDALLLIEGGEHGKSVLFNRPNHPLQEQWTGPRLGQANAPSVLGVDQAFSIDALALQLPEHFLDQKALYYPQGGMPSAYIGLIQQCNTNNLPLLDLTPSLQAMRLIKDAFEIECLKHAANVSVAAHLRSMKACRGLHHEYELEAEFLYELNRHGLRNVAYDSIVAGGKNACVLHYTANDQPLNPGELVLVDAGGEYDLYAADITRTYPVNGYFNAEQRALYNLVLQAQRDGIACVQPGNAWEDIQTAIVKTLTQGLVDLHLLRGNVEDLIEQEAYRPFYMHRSGHWLGLDVHDGGAYRNPDNTSRTLEPGMVLTVEPGLYLSASIPSLPPRFQNIGIRIEDDLLVTETGHLNLTGALPSDIDTLEAIICG